jgi:hypothetical protein
MNCQQFTDLFNDIAREQIIDAGAREQALGHSESCQSCAERLADERAITLGLRDLAEQMKGSGARARVEARLLAAFDELALIQLAPQVSARRYRARYLIGAIAAGLLIVFGLSVIGWRQIVPVTRDDGTPPVASSGAPAVPSITITSPPPIMEKTKGALPSAQRKFSNRPKGGAPASTRPANPGNTEIATDFLPLTYGAATNLAEGGRMVRVELPHSALATLGLPVNMDRANERVKADVLLGVDGLAHAIRFVR